MSVRVEIITDPARFATLRDAWDKLWRASGTHIFQTHDWLSGWIKGVRDRKEIRILIGVAWDADKLVGVMPFAVHRRSGLRVLHWAAQLFSDYCDCVIDPAYGLPDVLTQLWSKIRQTGGFDVVLLQQVRPDGQCRPFFDALAGVGAELETASRVDRCLRIDNHWPTGAAFFRSLPKKGRNNHTRGKRILSELGGDVAIAVIEPSQSVSAMLDEILQLKTLWLQTVDPKSSLLGADAIVQRSILESAWDSGLAKIFLLTYGGKIAAASINFVYANRLEAYLTSYEAACERASPGTILIVEYAQWAFDRGMKHVDFLRGDEAFKFRLANAETLIGSFTGSRTLLGQVAVSGHRWLARRRKRQEATNDDEQAALAEVS